MCSTSAPKRAGRAMSAAGGSATWSGRRGATRAGAQTFAWSVPSPDTKDHAIGVSLKAQSFTESVIREMTRLNLALHGPQKAVNFAQGFPDFDPDPQILDAAARALREGYNQYATTWGAPLLRQAIARKQSAAWGRSVDPETEITVSCGATEAMIAAMLAAVDPGDEVLVLAPPSLTAAIRKVHDFLTVGAAHPLQIAIAEALEFPPSFYVELLGDYQERRDAIVAGLQECGFTASSPDGAYYVMAGIEAFGADDDVAFARRLIEEVAVATVPASSFYHDPSLGRGHIRFSFPKKLDTIERGLVALRTMRP